MNLNSIIFTAVCTGYIILLVVYCMYEKKNDFKTATTLKVVLSAIASGTALYAAICLQNAVFYIFAAGMLCAVPADYFLQYIKSDLKKYRFGIFFFGLMHACILVSYYIHWGVHIYEFIIMAVLLLTLLIFQNKEHWKMGPERLQLTIYTVLVTLMAAKSISLVILEAAPYTVAAALGGLMFFVSDLFLGIWDYYDKEFVYLAANRVIYFAGQMALAFYLLLML